MSVRSSSLQRRKAVQSHSQQTSQVHVTFEDEKLHTALIQDDGIKRSNSFESEQFFDCLDDIDLVDGRHENDVETGARAQNYDNQIAIYSKRRVTYPDGTPAHVPAGESISKVPPGYLKVHKNDFSRAREMYQLTQQWRRTERVDTIHARPHSLLPKIKDGYPHFLHGFNKDGMLVMYEKPGAMTMKEKFREGMTMEDMLGHYRYIMEYMSNLEAVLTELHSEDGREEEDVNDGAWQEELAAYAHAKQKRLANDPISYGYCVVMDITGVGPSILSRDVLDYLQRSAKVSEEHYPGSMRNVYIANAPYFVGALFGGAKSVLPASIRESVSVDMLSAAETRGGGLKKFIDEEQIPEEYGGKSPFPLGAHPFEAGLRRLAKGRAEYEAEDAVPSAANSAVGPPLRDSVAPAYFSPSPPLLETNAIHPRRDYSAAAPAEDGTPAHEWDGLGSHALLAVTTILHFSVSVVVGSLEVVLPYWMVSPTAHGGPGCEAQRNGTAVLVSCLFVALAAKRPRLSRLARSAVDDAPLRGFRIGIGTTGVALAALGLVPLASDPGRSTTGLLCVAAHLALVILGLALGTLSLGRLRDAAAASSPGEVRRARGARSAASAAGRVVGCLGAAPIFCWSLQRDLFFPLNASFSLCLLACVCGLLYIVSFSLHVASPPPASAGRSRKMESQFTSAVVACISFIKEVFLVALADVTFLANGPSRKGASCR